MQARPGAPFIDLAVCGLGIAVTLGALFLTWMRVPNLAWTSMSAALTMIFWFSLPVISLRLGGWRADTRSHQAVRMITALLIWGTVMGMGPSHFGLRWNAERDPLGVLQSAAAGVLFLLAIWTLLAPLRRPSRADADPRETLARVGALSITLHIGGVAVLFTPWNGYSLGQVGVFGLLSGEHFPPSFVAVSVLVGGGVIRYLLGNVGANRAGFAVSALSGGLASLTALASLTNGAVGLGVWMAFCIGATLAMTAGAEWIMAGSSRLRSAEGRTGSIAG